MLESSQHNILRVPTRKKSSDRDNGFQVSSLTHVYSWCDTALDQSKGQHTGEAHVPHSQRNREWEARVGENPFVEDDHSACSTCSSDGSIGAKATTWHWLPKSRSGKTVT